LGVGANGNRETDELFAVAQNEKWSAELQKAPGAAWTASTCFARTPVITLAAAPHCVGGHSNKIVANNMTYLSSSERMIRSAQLARHKREL
jgi:hypothetical protein